MERQDLLTIVAAVAIVLILALVVKPMLTGEWWKEPPPGPAPVSPWQPRSTPAPPEIDAGAPTIEADYRWTAIDGGIRTWSCEVPEELFEYLRSLPRIPHTPAWGRYALSEEAVPYLSDLVATIAEDHFNTPDDAYYMVMDVIFFVQQIPYESDGSPESYYGDAVPSTALPTPTGIEYPKHPLETLVDGRGDCEDTAILAASILDMMGYDVVLLGYSDHMALGIEMSDFKPFYSAYPPKYFDYEGKRYYYVETTNYIECVRIAGLEENGTASNGTTIDERWGRPWSIGDAQGVPLQSVRTETPEIIPLRFVVRPIYHTVYPVGAVPVAPPEV
ncbi:hypothetical protein [Methanofollis fontis]|uniref:hypothetical protein n=1 Tax=Methanofollis fontis TaxID=2052832 RepID=UPI001A92A309|nr:hypothetical protein [Methanofollis fontis]